MVVISLNFELPASLQRRGVVGTKKLEIRESQENSVPLSHAATGVSCIWIIIILVYRFLFVGSCKAISC